MFELCKLDSNFTGLDSNLIKVVSNLIKLDFNLKVRNQGLPKLL
jgi:hypothetical protein